MNLKLVGPFSQLIPLNSLPLKGALSDDALQIIQNGGLLILNGKIADVGTFKQLTKSYPKAQVEHIEETSVCLPGLIDPHTHICFAGSRAQDYAMRMAGKTYLEIAKQGGGIWHSVTQTRAATEATLLSFTNQRASQLLKDGITTVEVKSGYALDVAGELKMLRVIQALNQTHPIDLIPTCLAAHMRPKDFEGSNLAYLEMLLQELLPIVMQNQLANRVDIFVEESAFSVEEARVYLQAAKKMGFDLVIHADQFSCGGSMLGIEIDALSVDHLEASGEMEIKALATSNVIPMALPGCSLGLGYAFAPCRKMLDAGASLAIGSDWNPGSAPMGDILIQASIMGMAEKLSSAELFAGMTFRAAAALNLQDRGKLVNGVLADFIAFPTDDYRDIFYYQGKMKPQFVWKRGENTKENTFVSIPPSIP